MSPHGAFPPQLVNLVIDEVGVAYQWNLKHSIFSGGGASEREALLSCALVSKKWTVRSRAHLFKEVKIEVREGQPTLTPPASVLPYIRTLELWCGHGHTQVPSTADLLRAFTTVPIEHLIITGVILVDKRACIQECIAAHSGTLQTVEFKGCSISAYNVSDVVLGHPSLKRLHLTECECEQLPPPGRPLIADTPNPGACPKAVEMELCISADCIERPVDMVTMVARLPYRFSKLDVIHFPTEEYEEAMNATNTLIKANADVLSSLKIRIFAEDMEIEVGPQHLPSLKGCSNLSEVTLDMERAELCVVRSAISILSTLDPARSSRLEKIILEANYVSRWFDKDGQPSSGEGGRVNDDEDIQADSVDDNEDWEGLDTVLSGLAKASISARGKRLTFTLVVVEWCNDKGLMSVVRKWLPKLLPRFNESGLLHVHHERGDSCRRAVDDSCLRHDKPDCLREDFKDRF